MQSLTPDVWAGEPEKKRGKLSFLGDQRRGETSGRGNGPRDWVKQFKFDANGHVGRHTAEIRVFWQCNPLREYPVIYRADFQVID